MVKKKGAIKKSISKSIKHKPNKSKKITKKKRDDEDMKGQMWSVDVIIGIVIFVSIITVFYTTLSGGSSEVKNALRSNAETVVVKFSQDPNLRIIDENNILNNDKLANLSAMGYDELKRQLGIEGDFCIYIEDENGRVVPIGSQYSIGKGDVNIGGNPCGT